MTFALKHDRPVSLARQEISIVCTAHRMVRVAVTADARGADPARSIAPLVRGWCHGRLPLLRRTSHHSEELLWLLARTLDEIADQVPRPHAAAALRAAAAEIARS
ncbi:MULTISPECIES: hypothetical protein [unclassified Nocardioides]|uniref:hypothetical protein n=1 Tax=unclassified Nocardioides TaxID=2615069 RepID=UPI0006FBBEB8|nr:MULTISPECIES: hypothetical protein [unclassified Nocardioides]KQY64502.1 hypothetical protein ASD30_06160 [Nocardioides sp. Root140]KQZ70427.1 hypothetical protein ASD66_12490 [Nocardioides sp. Root151]KRF18287.1 hypothetical protein ASH02_01630 [Nocardioides sp. Soil796]